jgi:hypothetical protein
MEIKCPHCTKKNLILFSSTDKVIGGKSVLCQHCDLPTWFSVNGKGETPFLGFISEKRKALVQ